MKPSYAPPRIARSGKTTSFVAPRTRALSPKSLTVATPLDARPSGPRVSPYLDYDRSLTNEGGIRITFKAESGDLLHILVDILVWLSAMAVAIWFIEHRAAQLHDLTKMFALGCIGLVNYFVVFAPHYAEHSVEIRPDCMIINGHDLFWLRYFDTGWPAFKQDETGRFILSGIYGSRHVEFLTLTRVDEHDRLPELLAHHLSEAMRQLWQPPRAR